MFSKIQEFTCRIYSTGPETKKVNELRYLLCVKKRKLESQQLPPCADCLKLHTQRASYQTAIWKRSLQGCPNAPSPIGHGWIQEDDKLVIKWMDGEPAPTAVLEFLSCPCTRSCKPSSCMCTINGLTCTDCGCDSRSENEAFEDNECSEEEDDEDS